MKSNRLHKGFATVLIAAHLAMTACQTNPLQDSGEQPVLPPPESMKMDFSYFMKPGAGKAGGRAVAGNNFNNAVVRVLIINTVVGAILALPALTLAAAASQKPELQDDGKFHWVYTYQDSNVTLQADLAGWIDVNSKESVWEMRVTNSAAKPPLQNFLWYEGRAALDVSGGYWEFYDAAAADSSTKVLRLDWTFSTPDTVSLEITVVKPGIPENGDRVTYRIQTPIRTVQFFDQSRGTTVEISWNVETGAGYLKAPDYNNGEKACWDEQRNDVPCPQ